MDNTIYNETNSIASTEITEYNETNTIAITELTEAFDFSILDKDIKFTNSLLMVFISIFFFILFMLFINKIFTYFE